MIRIASCSCPPIAAAMSGVSPSSSLLITSQPASMSTRATPSWPHCAASRSAVPPPSNGASAAAPAASSARHTSARPLVAAACRGRTPRFCRSSTARQHVRRHQPARWQRAVAHPGSVGVGAGREEQAHDTEQRLGRRLAAAKHRRQQRRAALIVQRVDASVARPSPRGTGARRPPTGALRRQERLHRLPVGPRRSHVQQRCVGTNGRG